jgi:hypothetical protein
LLHRVALIVLRRRTLSCSLAFLNRTTQQSFSESA